MRLQISDFSSFFRSSLCTRSSPAPNQSSVLAASFFLAAIVFAGPALAAQPLNRITQAVDTSRIQALPSHLPRWANAANSTGLAPADLPLNQITLVLARSAQQEAAFQQFLADQQNPSSTDYHHWLTPAEVGDRFGLSDQDIATITGWLQSQGLRVNWVAPSRIFVGFSGAASDVGRAFQTEMRYYSVNGEQRLSVDSDPMLPAALVPAIKAIRGLYTINERPLHQAGAMQSVSPQMTASGGNHYLAPADFATIYDLPASLTGAGVTIGIVDRSRTNFADFSNFRSLTGSTFPNPTEIVPTAFGGVDPGPAYTAPPGGSISTSEQGEATLDVLRAGSVAPGANLLLVVATSASGGIDADAEYLVGATPVPAQVMSISFGACESSAGSSGVTFWNSLFQTAVAEGISVFVSSGDAGASGCDTNGSAPPATPLPNSPNYICSSSYATCVGGTQFNDTSNPSQYWNSSSGVGLKSVLGYIPEGAWNESTTSHVAASGGGVSSIVPTPSWQIGTGVPAARIGRYTPDIAFSSSAHDGYFGCFAAAGAGCVVSGGSYSFEYFSGTSAAAPDMAGIAALLDQQMGTAQGNLNPQIYSLAASTPTAFHDATILSSGVSSCSVNTASLCNNSITLLSGSGAQSGYLLTTGYDEATGLGSLDVAVFLNNYATSTVTKTTPIITWSTPAAVAVGTALSTAQLNATASVPGTFVYTPTLGTVMSTLGSVTLSTTFTPADTTDYNTASASVTLTVTGTFTVSGTPVAISSSGATTGNTSTITVTPANGFTGSVTLTASITGPSGAQYPPTLSFGSTSPVNISSASPGTATLTVSTAASQQSSCVAANQSPRIIPWYAQGGVALACLLLFGIAPRRRNWRAMLGMLILFVAMVDGMSACGGGSQGAACTTTTTPGTTAGNYTITLTATSGSTSSTNTIALTVQ